MIVRIITRIYMFVKKKKKLLTFWRLKCALLFEYCHSLLSMRRYGEPLCTFCSLFSFFIDTSYTYIVIVASVLDANTIGGPSCFVRSNVCICVSAVTDMKHFLAGYGRVTPFKIYCQFFECSLFFRPRLNAFGPFGVRLRSSIWLICLYVGACVLVCLFTMRSGMEFYWMLNNCGLAWTWHSLLFIFVFPYKLCWSHKTYRFGVCVHFFFFFHSKLNHACNFRDQRKKAYNIFFSTIHHTKLVFKNSLKHRKKN